MYIVVYTYIVVVVCIGKGLMIKTVFVLLLFLSGLFVISGVVARFIVFLVSAINLTFMSKSWPCRIYIACFLLFAIT